MVNLMVVAKNRQECQLCAACMDWHAYGIEVQHTCTNLHAALAGCLENMPDLVIVSPWGEMRNILDFCGNLISLNPALKLLLVNAPRRYEYVQAAINIGVFAYLSEGEEMPEQFDRILKRIRDRQYLEQHSQHIVRRQLLRDILKGKVATGEEVEAYFGIKKSSARRYVFLLIRKDMPYPIMEVKPEIDYYAVRWHTTALPEGLTYIATVNLEMETWGMLLSMDEPLSEHQLYRVSYAAAVNMQRAYEGQRLSTVSIAISRAVTDLAELVGWTKQLQKLLEQCPYFGRRRIFTWEGVKVISASETGGVDEDMARLREAIRLGKADETVGVIRKAYAALMVDPGRYADLRSLVDQMLGALNQLRKRNYLPDMEWLCHENKCDFGNCYTIEDVRDWFIREFELVYSEISRHSTDQYSEKVAELVKLISSHYAKDYSISEMAKKLGLSSDYLRHIFKKETGESVQRFVINVRIEKAKAMLEEGQMKMADIAAAAGFSTVQYFCSVFRKVAGMSPTEYVKLSKRDGQSSSLVSRKL